LETYFGTIKRLGSHGYGWITADSILPGTRHYDIFFLFSKVSRDAPLFVGNRVSFNLEIYDKGPQAVNVKGLEKYAKHKNTMSISGTLMININYSGGISAITFTPNIYVAKSEPKTGQEAQKQAPASDQETLQPGNHATDSKEPGNHEQQTPAGKPKPGETADQPASPEPGICTMGEMAKITKPKSRQEPPAQDPEPLQPGNPAAAGPEPVQNEISSLADIVGNKI